MLQVSERQLHYAEMQRRDPHVCGCTCRQIERTGSE
jgi:hypothetical protein